jgi:hypothetical protein
LAGNPVTITAVSELAITQMLVTSDTICTVLPRVTSRNVIPMFTVGVYGNKMTVAKIWVSGLTISRVVVTSEPKWTAVTGWVA